MPMSSDLRNAFNAAAEGKATAAKAFHRYDHSDGVETEIISFTGALPDGTPFQTESGKLPGGTDLLTVAGQVARDYLAQQ